MIKVNGVVLKTGNYPDGTPAFKLDVCNRPIVRVTWLYDGENELSSLYYVARHLRDAGNLIVELYMPYIPNARMDRVKNQDEIFTLKYFAQFINSMDFDRVIVLDPHSNVATALIDRVDPLVPARYVHQAITAIRETDLVMVYPDEGAMKRYSGMFMLPYVFGVKKRDWRSGRIESLDIVGKDLSDYKTALICDDICSKGGTFLHTAKELKQRGVEKIYLFVSHCENTILDGEFINSGLVNGIFTTNSIFRKNHPLITVFDVEDAINGN